MFTTHIGQQTLYLIAATACAVIGAIHDLRSRRIPNPLTGSCILIGLSLHFILGGFSGLGHSLLGGVLAGAAFLLLFVVGGMGGGDVKLMTAVGCLSGSLHVEMILISTALIGAIIAVALACSRGKLRSTLSNVIQLTGHHAARGLTAHPELNLSNPNTLRLPYALPIALGCVGTLLLLHSGA